MLIPFPAVLSAKHAAALPCQLLQPSASWRTLGVMLIPYAGLVLWGMQRL